MDSIRKTILVFVTLVIVGLKLHYEYYNIAFPVIVITLTIIFLSKEKKAIIIVALNTLCILIPDKSIYKVINHGKYFWSEQDLTISDFKGTPDLESRVSAAVFPSIVGKINKVYNYPPAIVFTSNESKKSWIDTSLFNGSEHHQKTLNRLLEHEKLHLDITEVYTRKAQDSLNKMLFSSALKKYRIIEYYYQKSDSIQDVFDLETNHGINEKSDDSWSIKIMSNLK